MDPLSATASSIAIITLCVQVSRVLHSTIETFRNCPGELISLLTVTESFLIQLRRLDAIKPGLTDEHHEYLEEVCGDAWEKECRSTVEELNTLVWKVQTMGMGSGNPSQQVNTLQGQPKNDSGGEQLLVPTTPILGRLSWIFKKDDAIKISQKLSEHREVMFRALCTITMCG
jgi:hypothetical protein